MDQEQASPAHAEASHDVALGLEDHADEHESEEVAVSSSSGHDTQAAQAAPVDHAQLSTSVEGGHTGGETAHGGGGAAPTTINHKLATARTKEFDARAKTRETEKKARAKKQAAGADWTATQLARIIKNKRLGWVFVELDARKPAQGIGVLKTANTWDALITSLPAGKLDHRVRLALDHMVADSVLSLADAQKLFLPRFNHRAEDVGAGHWTMTLMQGTWRQLALLPSSDVSLNTAITTFQAFSGGGGFGPSWEAPTTINTIQLGDTNTDSEYLEHTVRHEVGHGVHTQIPGPINKWLKDDMEFWFLDDWNKWIEDLGGYPAKFNHPTAGLIDMTDPWKGAVKQMIETWCGSSSWSPSRATPGTGEDPALQAAYNAMPAPVKNAVAQSVTQWYDNYTNFQKVGDKRYFLNHWYHRPFTIGPTAYKAIAATNDTYTAMSEKEFFANCYAEYFNDPKGVKDHSKWGGTLPEDIKTFFKMCILNRQPYDKFKRAPRVQKA